MRERQPATSARSAGRQAASRAAPATPRPVLSPSSAGVLALQRAAGNTAVTGCLQRLRAERERRGPDGTERRSAVDAVLGSPGQPLAARLRAEMEARLGADFSDVRVHTGPAARRSAAALGARAYTSGSHVVVGDGGVDRRVLAHELTHVLQQRRGPVAGTADGTGLRISHPSDRHERAAEENAARALSGRTPGGRAPEPGGGVPRVRRSSSPVPVQRVIHQEPSYVAKGGGKTSLTNRGDIDIEERDGNVYVRVYQTVFAPVTGDSGHKDVHQGPDGSIDFRNQRDSAWLNMGRPWRSMHYMRTYQWQKNRDAPGGFAPPTARTTPLVRSFLVPLETYRRVTENAVSEKQINSVDDPRNMNQSTDKAKDSDQYQIRGAWMSEVAATALAGSLVTYAPDQLTEELRREPRHGSVEPLSALLGRLSMPDLEDFPEYRPAGARQGAGLLLPLDQGRMPDDRAQRKHIERLERLLTDAFPDDGNTGTRQVGNARAELKRFWGRPGDVDWEALHDRVRRAMNYAGMPAVLAEVFGTAEGKAALPDGGGFRVRDFGGTAAPAGAAAGHRRKPPRSGGFGARRAR
ncbi:eCIS core domain-containing protein [Streptomyces sp. L500]